jgi:ferredoxin
MSVIEKSRFVTFLEQHDQDAWNRILDRLVASIHPADQTATRIWFGFWPIELTQVLRSPEGAEEMARIMDMEGRWHLEYQIDSSVEFLYGAKYWPQVKKAVLNHAESASQPDGSGLEQQIRDVAQRVASEEKTDESLLLGTTAVAFMILQQVGVDRLAAVVDKPAEGAPFTGSPASVVARRRKARSGLLSFLRGANQQYEVVWDEKNRGTFKVLQGEDIASAAAKDKQDYRSVDYRRPEGPVPVECRIGSCGYCWIGIVNGKDNISPLTDYERKRLHYFGYDQANDPSDPTPPIRLACQARCEGHVTLVIPPWNGELKRRFDKARDKLGTA